MSLATMAVLAMGAFPSRGWADSLALGTSASDFTVYGSGSSFLFEINPAPATAYGNVGIGTGGKSLLHGSGATITGQEFFADPVTSTNFTTSAVNNASIDGSPFTNLTNALATGQVVQNSSAAATAQSEFMSVYNYASTLSATLGSQTGSITSNLTINTLNGSGGVYVTDLTGGINLANATLTLTGDSSDYFVFNIDGTFKMSAGGAIVLNGVSTDHVLFDMIGTGAVTASGSAMGNGTILAPNSNITFDLPGGSWTGRLFSDQTIDLFSEATIKLPTSFGTPNTASTPLPSTALAGMGLLAGVLLVGKMPRARRGPVNRG